MINLKELEKRLDKSLDKETKDSLNSWLNSQRINSQRELLITFLTWYKDYYPELRPIDEAVDYFIENIDCKEITDCFKLTKQDKTGYEIKDHKVKGYEIPNYDKRKWI